MNRDQHTHQEHYIQDTVQFEMYTCQNVTYNEAEYNDKNNGNHSCSYTVHHRLTQMIIFIAEDLYVVDQCRILWQTHDVCIKYTFLFQRRICHPHDRENTGKGEDDQDYIHDH